MRVEEEKAMIQSFTRQAHFERSRSALVDGEQFG